MSFPLVPRSELVRMGKALTWVEQQMGAHREPIPQKPNQLSNLAIRGYLLQNIYGGGSGVMALAYRTESRNATQISIVGTNYVANSSFRLQLSGTPSATDSNPSPESSTLFLTAPIPVNASAGDVGNALLVAAQAARKPVLAQDIVVSLGNPASIPDAVVDYPKQPDIVVTANDIQSYIGSWVVTINGTLLTMYDTLTFDIIQDSSAYMRGLSGLVQRKVVDLPGETRQIVFDVQNRPVDYPWVAGSLCGAIWYADLGYGIQWSDFREQTLSIPTSSS